MVMAVSLLSGLGTQHRAEAQALSYFLSMSIQLCILIGAGRDYDATSRVEIRSGHDFHQGLCDCIGKRLHERAAEQ
jgi:hypothetical protein